MGKQKKLQSVDYLKSNKISTKNKREIKALFYEIEVLMGEILRLKECPPINNKNRIWAEHNRRLIEREITMKEIKIKKCESKIRKYITPDLQKAILMKQKETDKSNLLKKKISLQKQILASLSKNLQQPNAEISEKQKLICLKAVDHHKAILRSLEKRLNGKSMSEPPQESIEKRPLGQAPDKFRDVNRFLMRIDEEQFIYLRHCADIRAMLTQMIDKHNFTKEQVCEKLKINKAKYNEFVKGGKNYDLYDVSRIEAWLIEINTKEVEGYKPFTNKDEK